MKYDSNPICPDYDIIVNFESFREIQQYINEKNVQEHCTSISLDFNDEHINKVFEFEKNHLKYMICKVDKICNNHDIYFLEEYITDEKEVIISNTWDWSDSLEYLLKNLLYDSKSMLFLNILI